MVRIVNPPALLCHRHFWAACILSSFQPRHLTMPSERNLVSPMWHSLMKWENIAVEILLVTLLTYEEGLQKQRLYETVSPHFSLKIHIYFMSDVAGLHLLFIIVVVKSISGIYIAVDFLSDILPSLQLMASKCLCIWQYSFNAIYGVIVAQN